MDTLRAYLNSISTSEQADFAARAGTTVGYLRKALSVGQRPGPRIVAALDRESGGALNLRYELYPDIFGPPAANDPEGGKQAA